MFKKSIFLGMCCCMILLGNTQVFASNNDNAYQEINKSIVAPYMDYIVNAYSGISISSSGTVIISSSVNGYQDTTTKVAITAKLQQYKNGEWTTLKTYTSESNSHRTRISETKSVSKGYSYRVQSTVKAYNGSSVETKIVTSSSAKY